MLENTWQQGLLPGLMPSGEISVPDAELYLLQHVYTAARCLEIFCQLQKNIVWRQDQLRIHGRKISIPRLNAWYGDAGADYSYSGIHFKALPWFPLLSELKEKAQTLSGKRFNSVLANCYRDGNDSVSWHSDDEAELGENPVIASFSFGATRDFALRHKTRRDLKTLKLPLTSGSLLVMTGSTQHYWQHQIPKSKRVTKARINLTFRQIK